MNIITIINSWNIKTKRIDYKHTGKANLDLVAEPFANVLRGWQCNLIYLLKQYLMDNRTIYTKSTPITKSIIYYFNHLQ